MHKMSNNKWIIRWDKSKCDDNCTDCFDTCPGNVICIKYQGDDKDLNVDTENCKRCESCSLVCDTNAITCELSYYDEDSVGVDNEFIKINYIDR